MGQAARPSVPTHVCCACRRVPVPRSCSVAEACLVRRAPWRAVQVNSAHVKSAQVTSIRVESSRAESSWACASKPRPLGHPMAPSALASQVKSSRVESSRVESSRVESSRVESQPAARPDRAGDPVDAVSLTEIGSPAALSNELALSVSAYGGLELIEQDVAIDRILSMHCESQ